MKSFEKNNIYGFRKSKVTKSLCGAILGATIIFGGNQLAEPVLGSLTDNFISTVHADEIENYAMTYSLPGERPTKTGNFEVTFIEVDSNNKPTLKGYSTMDMVHDLYKNKPFEGARRTTHVGAGEYSKGWFLTYTDYDRANPDADQESPRNIFKKGSMFYRGKAKEPFQVVKTDLVVDNANDLNNTGRFIVYVKPTQTARVTSYAKPVTEPNNFSNQSRPNKQSGYTSPEITEYLNTINNPRNSQPINSYRSNGQMTVDFLTLNRNKATGEQVQSGYLTVQYKILSDNGQTENADVYKVHPVGSGGTTINVGVTEYTDGWKINDSNLYEANSVSSKLNIRNQFEYNGKRYELVTAEGIINLNSNEQNKGNYVVYLKEYKNEEKDKQGKYYLESQEKAKQFEAERVSKEKAAKAEQERVAKEKAAKAEQERVAKEKAAKTEAERVAKEKAAKAEQERVAKEKAAKAEAEKVAKEKAAKAEAERVAKEKAAKAEAEKVAKEKAAKAEAERVAKEKAAKAETERVAKEKAIKEKEALVEKAIEEVNKPEIMNLVTDKSELKVTRFIDEDGKDLKDPVEGEIKADKYIKNDKGFITHEFDKTETIEGITTHKYKKIVVDKGLPAIKEDETLDTSKISNSNNAETPSKETKVENKSETTKEVKSEKETTAKPETKLEDKSQSVKPDKKADEDKMANLVDEVNNTDEVKNLVAEKDELKVTRFVTKDGKEIKEAEVGENKDKEIKDKDGNVYELETTETKDGITTNVYKLKETTAETNKVTSEENKETSDNKEVTEGTKSEVKEDVKVEDNKETSNESKPSDEVKNLVAEKDELKVTRFVTKDGKEIKDAVVGENKDKEVKDKDGNVYELETTDTKDGITTNVYKLKSESKKSAEDKISDLVDEVNKADEKDSDATKALVNEKEELKVTRFLNDKGKEIKESVVGENKDKEIKDKDGNVYELESTDTTDGITTNFYKLKEDKSEEKSDDKKSEKDLKSKEDKKSDKEIKDETKPLNKSENKPSNKSNDSNSSSSKGFTQESGSSTRQLPNTNTGNEYGAALAGASLLTVGLASIAMRNKKFRSEK